MLIGIDFDNTIVSYDDAFHVLASERELVTVEVSPTKEAVRDHLRASGREDDWTELQGHVYGPGMELVSAFPGFFEFLGRCEEHGGGVAIVSHKTRHPYRGPRHDLHESARRFLERAGIAVPAYFEETKARKLARIGELGCTHFVDDLPEFLTEPSFPPGVERVLFDPNGSEACARAAAEHGLARVESWREARDLLLP